MQNVPVVDCPDGICRAEAGALASAGRFIAKTASYSVTPAESGKIFTNTGAAGSVTFTLPAPKEGLRYEFVRTVPAQNIVLNRASGNFRGPLTPFTGTAVTASTANEYASVEVVSDGVNWFLRSISGTWTIS